MTHQQVAAIGLLLCLAGAGTLAGTVAAQPPLPPLPEGPETAAEAPVTSPLQLPLPETPAAGVVFAPFPGKSSCGEFDSPWNNYYGDGRQNRSLVLGHAWLEMEYLAWASQPTHLPPLVSTSPLGTDPADAGILGPNGSVLFGGTQTQHDLRSGARLNFGYWFTPAHEAGLEAHFLWLDGHKIDQFAAGGDDLILANPIVDATSGLNSAVLISFPGLQDGEARVRSNMQLFGIEWLGRCMLGVQGCSRLDFLGGYRYLRLEDNARVDSIFLSLDDSTGFDADSIVARTDGFSSKNEFHGGEFGLVYRWWNCCWAVNLTGKVALGGTRTIARVTGTTTVISPTDDVTETPGGVFAQPSNLGQYARSDFAAIGDLGVRVEYAFTPQLRLMAGYNWLAWSSVARIGDSIDTTVDPSQIAPRPSFAFRPNSFWTHGLTFGLHYDF